jgi:hypothetical protein
MGLVLAGSLVLTGCGGGSTTEDTPDSQSTAAASTLLGRWPLTGLPAQTAAPRHPVMAVKIDNTSSSNPQVGLGKADLVVEELVEGGATRLAAQYYSKVPAKVGPVRSMRATDIGILQPADATLVASGGARQTVRRMRVAGVKTVTEGGPGYYRDSGRSAPYNLFMNLPKLAKTLTASGAPQSYFQWGSEKDFPRGQKARSVQATFSAGHTTSWRYKGGSYANLNSEAAPGDEFRPKTVLVLKVKVGNAGYLDPAGNPVPETLFTGTGEALVFHGGTVVEGRWVKNGLDAPVKLKTRSGELALPAGKVWMELVPKNGGNVTFGK